ncbi:hypothetical protein [Stackebrandtia soli]|uniref:hypothetical protein n=1 Tax=Stackebrandtia soli TaxID=1892856 RepID=UPI0039EA1634
MTIMIAGSSLQEWPRIAAEWVAPQTMLRIHTGWSVHEHLVEALTVLDARGAVFGGGYLVELVAACRVTAGQIMAAAVEVGGYDVLDFASRALDDYTWLTDTKALSSTWAQRRRARRIITRLRAVLEVES